MAPHSVCPKTSTSFTPSAFTLNSKLPTMLPSALESVFPALRSTKTSPGVASKSNSTGARESAQPNTEAMGFCPYSASAPVFDTSQSFNTSALPLTKRSFPSMSLCKASPARTGFSASVRAPDSKGTRGLCPLRSVIFGMDPNKNFLRRFRLLPRPSSTGLAAHARRTARWLVDPAATARGSGGVAAAKGRTSPAPTAAVDNLS
mmetsp:Transcript_9939/g.28858  ORF Transcript_9939/g.28858 Transcript_9939/m.28858 type:complete len:204 (+) Transcript_9939:596-1207(+)